MADGAEALLRASSAEGVVTALRAVIRDPDGPYTLLSPLTRPAQLERLRLVAADFTVTSSIAESCLGQAAWHRYWYEPLVRATFATVLGDVPINNWIQWIEDAESSRVRGCVYEFSPDDSRKPAATEAMVLVADALDRLPRIFCGSPHMTEAFAGLLQTSPSIELEIDEDIVEEGGETLAVVGRLVDEEPWFDRLGLASFGLLRSAAHGSGASLRLPTVRDVFRGTTPMLLDTAPTASVRAAAASTIAVRRSELTPVGSRQAHSTGE